MVMNFSASQLSLSIQRSLHAYFMYHSGAFSDFGMNQEYVDGRVEEAGLRLLDEGHIDPISEVYRVRSMNSIRAQVLEHSEAGSEYITLDCQIIELAYHLPQFIPEEMTDEDLADLPSSFTTWDDFLATYRRLGYHLTYHYERTMEELRNCQNQHLARAHWHYGEQLQNNNPYFRGPEYRVTGTTERDRAVRQCLESSELGLLVRVRGQITNISAKRTSFMETAYRCSRCSTTQRIPQNEYDDQLIKPASCDDSDMVGGCGVPARDANFQILEPPESRAITIRRALLQEEWVDSSDSPVLLIEFRGSVCEEVDAGQVVTFVGYIRSRPADSKSRSDRNREVYMIVTGIERNEQSRDITVDDSREEEIMQWASSHTFSEKIEILTRSFCPEIVGRDKVKHGLMLQQFGGSQGAHELRSDIHIFVFGDPGTGKSVLARYLEDIHRGTRYVSAERATKAGLVAGISSKAEMFSGGDKRVIEPGAMALTPPGAVCIIDEAQFLDSGGRELSPQLNTALERQEVPVEMTLKGKVATKCPVLLIANPKKGDSAKFDPDSMVPLSDQAGIKKSTMTRGDLVYFLLDYGVTEDEEMLRAMSILSKMNGLNPTFGEGDTLDLTFVSDFFAVGRTFSSVSISDEAMSTLAKDQVFKRVSASGEKVSMRRVASLARLTQAAAKLDFKTVADVEHAEFALSVISAAQQDISPESVDGGIGEKNRKVKRLIFSAIEDAWSAEPPTGGGWTISSIPMYVEKYWNVADGIAPTHSQVTEAVKSFSKESESSSVHGPWRSYGKGNYGFDN